MSLKSPWARCIRRVRGAKARRQRTRTLQRRPGARCLEAPWSGPYQCDHTDDKRKHQQSLVLLLQAKRKGLTKHDRNQRNHRDGQANCRKCRSQRQVQAGLQPVGLRCSKRRQTLRKQHHARDDDPDYGFWHAEPVYSCLHRRRERFREPHYHHERDKQQGCAGGCRPV